MLTPNKPTMAVLDVEAVSEIVSMVAVLDVEAVSEIVSILVVLAAMASRWK